jgi:serine/threonine protein kinase
MLNVDRFTIGQELGSYRIEALLGVGGMGVVYLAQDRELRRRVAIKVVERTRTDVDAGQLLLHEARVAAALQHPSICSIHELGRHNDEPYIVMEHVEGRPLSTVIPEGKGLPLEPALHYVMQIVDAIAHAHRQGIVHGDLKSANVMIAADGRVKILDFGLAVHEPPERGLRDCDSTRPYATTSGAGTVPYMAPELLRGRAPDTRTDIWAIGVLFYEMTAGRRPFSGATAYEIAAAILMDPPIPPPSHLPAAPRALVMRCLAKNPADRFATVTDLASALDSL